MILINAGAVIFTFDSLPETVVCESSEGGKFGVSVFV